jgi:hypothetical protein
MVKQMFQASVPPFYLEFATQTLDGKRVIINNKIFDYSIVTLVENLNIEYHRKLRDHSFIKALPGFLSDNCLKQSQNNAVVPTQEEMDWVGVEPTTSAIFLKPRLSIVQIPPAPLCMLLSGQWQDVFFVRMNGSQHHGSRRKNTS